MVRLASAALLALAATAGAAAAAAGAESNPAPALPPLRPRHGDEPHEPEPPALASGHGDSSDAAAHAHPDASPEPDAPHGEHDHDHAPEAGSHAPVADDHEHDGDGHHHTIAIPHAEPGQLVPVPWIPGGGAGTHEHKGHHAPVLEHLNETNLFLSSGPSPLSYIEWDYGHAMGSDAEVARFADPEALARPDRLMGDVDGVWRTLFDTRKLSAQQRKELEQELVTYIPDDGHIRRHRRLMLAHIVGCVLATVVLCPIALALKAGHSSLAPLACLVYLVTLGGSIFLGQIYNALTPPLYPSNAHGKMGHIMFWVSLVALGKDVFQLVSQLFHATKSALGYGRLAPLDHSGLSLGGRPRTRWGQVVRIALGQDEPFRPEKQEALLQEQDRMLEALPDDVAVEVGSEQTDEPPSPVGTLVNAPHHQGPGSEWLPYASAKIPFSQTSSSRSSSPQSASLAPSSTGPPNHHNLRNEPPKTTDQPTSMWRKLRTIFRYTHVVVNRSLPLFGFACGYTGLAIYTGTCRGGRVNTCAAHGIKGAIFFWYGLLTWARYLGVYAEHGYAWNRKPTLGSSRRPGVTRWRRNVISGEFIECMVIFVYGVTNTWMERFGAKPGDPYTIKQIQHISIAVMFWFGGLVGLFLETRRLRDLFNFAGVLNHPSAHSPPSMDRRAGGTGRTARSGAYSLEGVPASDEADELVNVQAPPPSYASSFNPFPAVIIGLTGSAMSAHHQDYEYEVQIHVLWGNALAAFGVFRLLTYVFLWLRPPTSILPSRPPTEALAAFCLAGGGLAFMLSSEEVSFAAMRAGYDDVMAILCFLVAVVCLCFCFTAVLLLIKNWALRREFRRARTAPLTNHSSSGPLGAPSPPRSLARPAPGRAQAQAQTQNEEIHLQPLSKPVAQPAAAARAAMNEGSSPVFVLEEEEDEELDAAVPVGAASASSAPAAHVPVRGLL